MNTYKSTQSNTTNNASGHAIDLIGDTNTTENNHITSSSRAGYICTFAKIITYFYDNDKQHILVHFEELSQVRKKYIEWSSSSIWRKGQTKTKRNLRQTCMAHIHAMSRGKNNSPIKIEGYGCLAYEDIASLMN